MHDRLTASDIKKMEEEIEYRKLELRKELIQDVKDARAQGDLSENFEYYAAKREKNKRTVFVWVLLRRGAFGSNPVLSGKLFPYFQRISGDRGCK